MFPPADSMPRRSAISRLSEMTVFNLECRYMMVINTGGNASHRLL